MREVDAEKGRFEELFKSYHAAVRRYARRRAPLGLADDVVSETFLVAWRRLDDIPADPLPWLLAVARRTIATQHRAAARRAALVRKAADATQPDEETFQAALATGGLVSEALARLRPLDREAITLVAWDGLSTDQAAASLGLNSVTFRVRLHRAKRRLTAELDQPVALDGERPAALPTEPPQGSYGTSAETT